MPGQNPSKNSYFFKLALFFSATYTRFARILAKSGANVSLFLGKHTIL